MVDENRVISIKQAYAAMYRFLEIEFELTSSADIGGLLGGLSLLDDGSPADIAAWDQWLQSVDDVLHGNVDISLGMV